MVTLPEQLRRSITMAAKVRVAEALNNSDCFTHLASYASEPSVGVSVEPGSCRAKSVVRREGDRKDAEPRLIVGLARDTLTGVDMIGDEARVTDAFCVWLREQGWSVHVEQAYCDVAATRAGQALFAEVKGRTASPGLDVDTLYGQLLRRVPGDAGGRDIFAVVVPEIAVKFAVRVPAGIRDTLGIHVYGVSEDGHVNHVGEPDPAR